MNSLYEDVRFTTINDKDFTSKRIIPIAIVLSIIFAIGLLGFVYYDTGNIDGEMVIASVILAILAGFFVAILCTLKETLDLQKQKKFLHNKNIEYVKKASEGILSKNDFATYSKEISIFYKDAELRSLENLNNEWRIALGSMKEPEKKREIFYNDKLVINTETSKFGYLCYEINEITGEEKYNFNAANFNELIDFELVDKTTSTQISLAKTSSNSSDAFSGAVVSEFLFNDAATGAIIGASSDVTTETVTQTLKDELYQINIQLNNIQNPIIRIETKSRETVSQIIAMLKIIMNKNKVKES